MLGQTSAVETLWSPTPKRRRLRLNAKGAMVGRNTTFSQAYESGTLTTGLRNALNSNSTPVTVSVEVMKMLGDAETAFVSGNDDDCIAILNELAHSNPSLPDTYSVLALIYEGRNDELMAMENYLKAAHLSSRSYPLWRKVVQYALRIGEYKQALWSISKCLRLYPTAYAQAKADETPTDLHKSSDALEQDELYLMRLQVLLNAKLGRVVNIRETTKTFLQRFPEEKLILADIGHCVLEEGFPKLSLDHYHRFFALCKLGNRVATDVGSLDQLEWVIRNIESIFYSARKAASIMICEVNDLIGAVTLIEDLFSLFHQLQEVEGVALDLVEFPPELFLLLGYAQLRLAQNGEVSTAMQILSPPLQSVMSSSGDVFIVHTKLLEDVWQDETENMDKQLGMLTETPRDQYLNDHETQLFLLRTLLMISDALIKHGMNSRGHRILSFVLQQTEMYPMENPEEFTRLWRAPADFSRHVLELSTVYANLGELNLAMRLTQSVLRVEPLNGAAICMFIDLTFRIAGSNANSMGMAQTVDEHVCNADRLKCVRLCRNYLDSLVEELQYLIHQEQRRTATRAASTKRRLQREEARLKRLNKLSNEIDDSDSEVDYVPSAEEDDDEEEEEEEEDAMEMDTVEKDSEVQYDPVVPPTIRFPPLKHHFAVSRAVVRDIVGVMERLFKMLSAVRDVDELLIVRADELEIIKELKDNHLLAALCVAFLEAFSNSIKSRRRYRETVLRREFFERTASNISTHGKAWMNTTENTLLAALLYVMPFASLEHVVARTHYGDLSRYAQLFLKQNGLTEDAEYVESLHSSIVSQLEYISARNARRSSRLGDTSLITLLVDNASDDEFDFDFLDDKDVSRRMVHGHSQLIFAASEISSDCRRVMTRLIASPGDTHVANLLFHTVIRDSLKQSARQPIRDLNAKYLENQLTMRSLYSVPGTRSAALHLIMGHEQSIFKKHDIVLDHYLDAFTTDPDQPLISLCLGTYIIYLASHPLVKKRVDTLFKGLLFLMNYQRLRSTQASVISARQENLSKEEELALLEKGDILTAAACAQECLYNMGRAFQELQQLSLAADQYREALSFAELYPQLRDETAHSTLNVTREAAHNLITIYRQSGANDLACYIMSEYLCY